MSEHRRAAAYVAFAVTSICWGSNFLAIRVAIETMPTLLLTGLRFGIAGAILMAVCLLTRQALPLRRSEWWRQAVIGTMMIGGGATAVVWAEHYISSGWTALLLSTGPFWMVLLESLRGNRQLITVPRLAGIGVGFLGVLLLIAPKVGSGQQFDLMFVLGVIALQVAGVAWGIGSIWAKYGGFHAGPFVTSAIQMLAGGSVLLIAGLAVGESAHFSVTRRTFPALIFLTLFGSLGAYSAYVYSLSRLSTVTVSLFDYVVPAIAVLLGWLLLDEPLDWRTVISLLLITSGIAFEGILDRFFSSDVSLPAEAVQEE